MVPWLLGGWYISNPSIGRYLIIHSILPGILWILLVFHVLYIHRISTSTSTGIPIYNTRVHFHVYTSIGKDTLVVGIYTGVVLVGQVYQGIVILAHPDNSLEVSILYTPIHIVPE